MKSYDRLWETLNSSRITTLDDFIHAAVRDERLSSGGAILRLSSDSEPAPTFGSPATLPIVHRRSTVPLILDGKVLHHSDEISSFNQKPLFYTPLRSSSGVALAAFTSREQMLAQAKHMRTSHTEFMIRTQFEQICQQPPDSLPEQACFFEHIGEGGDVVCLPPAQAYHDLTLVGRTKVLWWYTTDWNDVISSVSWSRWDVSLFEHINYGGSELWLPAGCNTPNLVELGWNDRASAIVNWGQRF